jgi:hypothetical protein
MRKYSFLLGLLIPACILLAQGCKETAPTSSTAPKPAKWLHYDEKTKLEEQHLKARLRVERREALTNTLADTGEVWFVSEVTTYNIHGQPLVAQEKDVTGKVVKETRTDYRDSLITRQAVSEASGYSSAIEYSYDSRNLKTAELVFQRGDTTMRRDYQVDALGNELQVDLFRFRDSVRMQLRTVRDSLGRPVSVKEMQGDQANWSEAYTLSDTLWRIKRTGQHGELQSDYEIKFDSKGRIVHMMNRTAEGKPRLQVNYVHDAQGHLLRESYFGGNAQPFQTVEFKYDEKGLLIERKLSTPNQPFVLTTRYTYTFRE